MNLLELRPNVTTVTVNEAELHLRELSGADRAALQKLASDYEKAGKPNAELVTHMVILSVCDPDGKRLYSAKDFDAINGLPASVLDKIAEASRKINGFDEDALTDAKKN